MNSFQSLLQELEKYNSNGYLSNMTKTGYDEWTTKINTVLSKTTKQRENLLTKLLTRKLRKSFINYKRKNVYERNSGLKAYTLKDLYPKFAKAYRFRANASLDLIKSQNEEAMFKLRNRFKSWLTSSHHDSLDMTLPSTGRVKFILRDQTNKMMSNLDNIVAEEYKAVCFQWKTRNDNRVVGKPGGLYPEADKTSKTHGNHWERKDKFYYYVKSNQLHKLNLSKFAGSDKSLKDGMPGTPIGCRCWAKNYYNVDDLPEELVK